MLERTKTIFFWGGGFLYIDKYFVLLKKTKEIIS